jgi:hypothetical protein
MIDIKVGDIFKVTSTYSSYGSLEDETVVTLTAKQTDEGVRLFKEDDKRWYGGTNSTHKFERIAPTP